MDNSTVDTSVRSATILMDWRDALRIIATGVVIGLVAAALFAMFDKYVFTPILCDSAADAVRCDNKQYFAGSLAMILAGVAGLYALVQQRAFRPLLVVLLVELALWNAVITLAQLTWWQNAIAAGVLFGLAFAAFAWLVQLRNLYIATGLSVVLAVAVRLVLF